MDLKDNETKLAVEVFKLVEVTITHRGGGMDVKDNETKLAVEVLKLVEVTIIVLGLLGAIGMLR